MDEKQRATGRFLARWLGILFGGPLVLALSVPALALFAVPIAAGLLVARGLLARDTRSSGRGLTVLTGLVVAALVAVFGRELYLVAIVLIFGAS